MKKKSRSKLENVKLRKDDMDRLQADVSVGQTQQSVVQGGQNSIHSIQSIYSKTKMIESPQMRKLIIDSNNLSVNDTGFMPMIAGQENML